MPQLKTPAYYLDAAETLLKGGSYSKEKEATFRSILKLAETAAALDSNGSTSKRSALRIEYSSGEERDAWVDYLRTGRYTKRDMTSGGSGIRSTSPLVPLQFFRRVQFSLKLVDGILDPEVSQIITTPTGAPIALPMDYDVTSAASVVAENAQASATDTTMGALCFCRSLRLGELRSTARLNSRRTVRSHLTFFWPRFFCGAICTRLWCKFSRHAAGGRGPDDDTCWRGQLRSDDGRADVSGCLHRQ